MIKNSSSIYPHHQFLVTLPVLIYNKHFNSTTCKFYGTAVYGDLATTSNHCFHDNKLHHCNITLCMSYIIQTGVSMVTNCITVLCMLHHSNWK